MNTCETCIYYHRREPGYDGQEWGECIIPGWPVERRKARAEACSMYRSRKKETVTVPIAWVVKKIDDTFRLADGWATTQKVEWEFRDDPEIVQKVIAWLDARKEEK